MGSDLEEGMGCSQSAPDTQWAYKQQEQSVAALQDQTAMIRHNTDLLGSIGEQMPDEEVRKHLLELNEDQHDEKREALAVFNNKEIATQELANLNEQKASLELEI